ncbi:MAG: hypothetical protein ACHQHN_07435 [Sphingobacteriales bacterium]
MVISNGILDFKRLKNLADWKLLLFLILFLDVKLVVKVAAIILIYILQSNFKFGFRFKNSRLPLFYLLAIGIAIINWLIGQNYGNINYDLVLLTGVSFWLLCILGLHQVKLSVEKNDVETINRTIIIFFALNALLSFINLAVIIYHTGHLNPYTYQGEYQKYFISTGDYIRGIAFDTSITNAVLNAFGVIYFLSKKNSVMLLVCMAVMLLTGSNFIDLVLLIILVVWFVVKSIRDQKGLIAVCLMFLLVFMARISPQNLIYLHETIKNNLFPLPVDYSAAAQAKPLPYITLRPDSTLTPDEKKEKTARAFLDSIYIVQHPNPAPHHEYPIITDAGRIITPGTNINLRPYQHVADTTAYQKKLLAFINVHKASLPLSDGKDSKPHKTGKALCIAQTLGFLKQHPVKILTGDGMGNFSSKLAFKATGLGIEGGYPQKYTYINPDFLSNHLDIYLDFFSKNSDNHSLTNNPGSVYEELLAEYGLLGLAAFLVCYLWYFLKHYKRLTYGLPVLVMLIAIFFIDYWFEQLSVILFFELLLLLNIKERSPETIPAHAN